MKKYIVLVFLISIISCQQKTKKNGKLQVVTTTTMITDLVKNIGGDKIDIQGLMGAGVDPHLYKASAGDVSKLFNADVIVYSGLHLEGKLEDVFEKMRQQNKKTIAASDAIDTATLIGSEYFASSYDPHIWFDITNWESITKYITAKFCELDAENAATYKENGANYLMTLQEAVRAKGKEVVIGGTLYSDALGSKGTAEETYVGMYKHNVNIIVNSLK